jgi:hypothetical protein
MGRQNWAVPQKNLRFRVCAPAAARASFAQTKTICSFMQPVSKSAYAKFQPILTVRGFPNIHFVELPYHFYSKIFCVGTVCAHLKTILKIFL